jgi:rubrerythrin
MKKLWLRIQIAWCRRFHGDYHTHYSTTFDKRFWACSKCGYRFSTNRREHMSKTYREKLYDAWEWLRAEAMKDNEHAQVLLERLDKLERERKEARAKRQ